MNRCSSLLLAFAVIVAGCRDDRRSGPDGPMMVPAPASSVAPAQRMTVRTTDVRADPSVDVQEVRATLRDAETSLVECVSAGSATGALVLGLAIERDGAVSEVRERSGTTLQRADARACVDRALRALRFPSGAERREVEITLEVAVKSSL